MAESQENEPGVTGPSADRGLEERASAENVWQSRESSCTTSSSLQLSGMEPGVAAGGTVPPSAFSGEDGPDVDLSSVLEQRRGALAQNLDILYKPSVTVQSVGVKIHSTPMAADTASEFVSGLSKITGAAEPGELENLPEATVHCNRVSIEGCIQHLFRFFVFRPSQPAPPAGSANNGGDPPSRAVEAVQHDEGASTSMEAADLSSASCEDALPCPVIQDRAISRRQTSATAEASGGSLDSCEHEPPAKPSIDESAGEDTEDTQHGTRRKKLHSYRPTHPALCENLRPIMHAALLLFQLISCGLIIWKAWDFDDDGRVCILQHMIRLLVPWVPIVVFWPFFELFHEKISLLVRSLRLVAMGMLVLGLLQPVTLLRGQSGPVRGGQVIWEAVAFPLVLQNAGKCEGLERTVQLSQIFCQAVVYPLCYQVNLRRSVILSGLEAGVLVLAGVGATSDIAEPPPIALSLIAYVLSCVLVCSVEFILWWSIARQAVCDDV